MADAGVSTTVIVTFVECSSSTDPLTDTEIIALKKHNVADEVVTALMKQGAKSRALAAQRRNEAVASFVAARNARFNGLDPESYEYFRYYYLEPRALSSAYQRLSPYYPPRGSYTYGPSSAFGFGNHFYGRPGY